MNEKELQKNSAACEEHCTAAQAQAREIEAEADRFDRTKKLIGEAAFDRLENSKVLVIGVGGVGGYVCEALCRAGIGGIDIIDKDTVDITNINRQIIATTETVGRPKAEVMRERMLSVNSELIVNAYQCFYLPETADDFDFSEYGYIVDAVDNVTAKLEIICRAKAVGTPVISSMGTGNKLDPSAFKIADIEKTKVCPLARVIRKELKKRGVHGVKVLYSEEEPVNTGSRTPASISFVPASAGLLITGEVVRDLMTLPPQAVPLP